MTTMTDTRYVTVGRGDVVVSPPTGVLTQVGDRDYVVLGNGRLLEACGRCEPAWSGSVEHFGHVYAGVCFECAGYGYRKAYDTQAALEKVLARRAKDKARRERKAEAERAAKQAARDEWAAANPEVAADLFTVAAVYAADDNAEINAFLLEVAFKSTRQALTDKQVEAVAPLAAAFLVDYPAGRLAEAAKAKAQRYADEDASGKARVTGTVTVAMTLEGYYGPSRLVVVEGTGDDAGVTVKMFGTGQGLWDADRGDQVTVYGTVKDREVYRDVKQTVLTRAKITTLTKAEDES